MGRWAGLEVDDVTHRAGRFAAGPFLPKLTTMKKSFPETHELFYRVKYVLDFMLKHFQHIHTYRKFWNQSGVPGLEKKVAHEFALLTFLVYRLPHRPPALDFSLVKALDALSGFVYTRENYLAILDNPQQTSVERQIHFFLTLCDQHNAEWDALDRKLSEKGFTEESDKIIIRIFDSLWQKSLLTNNYGYLQKATAYSIFNSGCRPGLLSHKELYVFTHELMYLSDFGRQQIVPGNNCYLKELVEHNLLLEMSRGNFDLLGEFLMAYSFLADEWDSLVSHVSWKYYIQTWDSAGFLPGPSFESSIFEKLEGEERNAYAFREMYHANLVAGILCVALLQGGKRNGALSVWYPKRSSVNRTEIEDILNRAKNYPPGKNGRVLSVSSDLMRNELKSSYPGLNFSWYSLLNELLIPEPEKCRLLLDLQAVLALKERNFDQLLTSLQRQSQLHDDDSLVFDSALEYLCLRENGEGSIALEESLVPKFLDLLKIKSEKLAKREPTDEKLAHHRSDNITAGLRQQLF